MQTRIDGLGRIVIPKKIRDDLGLSEGSMLDIVLSDKSVVITSKEHDNLLEYDEGMLVYAGEVMDDKTDIVKSQRNKRLKELY